MFDKVITPEEIASLKAQTVVTEEAQGGWDTNYLFKENEELKQELKKLGGMTPSEVEVEAENRAQKIAVEVATKIKRKLEDPAFINVEALVEMELTNLKAKEEAKRRYKTENIDADLSLFDGTLSLEEALKANYELPAWRVEGMLRVGHITTVAGMAKAGKTSFLVNRVRSFVDHQPLFGTFQMGQVVEGNVGVWNFELTPGQMVDWFKKSGINNTKKVRLINARGAGLFIQNRIVVEKAIEWINRNNIEILEIDPLQAAFVGSIISDEDAGDFISALQRIQKESCVSDIILTTHMGHGAKNSADMERSIGSARWEGFADNLILFTRKGDEPAKLRIDRGRDITLDEISLVMDPETKLMTKVFVPKAIDRNWNAMLGLIKDGQAHEKRLVKEANGPTDTKNKTAINNHLKDLKAYGVLEEFKMKRVEKEETCTEYSVDGKYGQAIIFVKLLEVGCNLLHEETEEVPVPDRLWWEGQGFSYSVDSES